ncbi:hypothetical protein WJX81_004938 [Elliptochloris bilobata]|uniref:EF-hand domain-containing protein n=1 Tax=Elliptochloris bilobata TaxID=381761 RepID=A0AAW1SCT8_9CHLO
MDAEGRQKVEDIFASFDKDKDGVLNRDELANYINSTNPNVQFTSVQMLAILEEIMVDYQPWWRRGGLTLEGLVRTYADGISNAAADHATLGLHLAEHSALGLPEAPAGVRGVNASCAEEASRATDELQSFPVALSPMKPFGGQGLASATASPQRSLSSFPVDASSTKASPARAAFPASQTPAKTKLGAPAAGAAAVVGAGAVPGAPGSAESPAAAQARAALAAADRALAGSPAAAVSKKGAAGVVQVPIAATAGAASASPASEAHSEGATNLAPVLAESAAAAQARAALAAADKALGGAPAAQHDREQAAGGKLDGKQDCRAAVADSASKQEPASPGALGEPADGEAADMPGSLSGVAALLSKLAALPAGGRGARAASASPIGARAPGTLPASRAEVAAAKAALAAHSRRDYGGALHRAAVAEAARGGTGGAGGTPGGPRAAVDAAKAALAAYTADAASTPVGQAAVAAARAALETYPATAPGLPLAGRAAITRRAASAAGSSTTAGAAVAAAAAALAAYPVAAAAASPAGKQAVSAARAALEGCPPGAEGTPEGAAAVAAACAALARFPAGADAPLSGRASVAAARRAMERVFTAETPKSPDNPSAAAAARTCGSATGASLGRPAAAPASTPLMHAHRFVPVSPRRPEVALQAMPVTAAAAEHSSFMPATSSPSPGSSPDRPGLGLPATHSFLPEASQKAAASGASPGMPTQDDRTAKTLAPSDGPAPAAAGPADGHDAAVGSSAEGDLRSTPAATLPGAAAQPDMSEEAAARRAAMAAVLSAPAPPRAAPAPAAALPETLERVLTGVQRALQSGNDDALAPLLIRVGRLGPAEAHAAYLAIGSLLASMGKHERAAECFKAALALRSGEARTLFKLGNACFALQRYAAAEEAFEQALRDARSPADDALVPKVHVNLGITQEADGRLLAACEHYRGGAARAAGHPRAHKLLGSALYALGDLRAARDELTAALALQPDYADARCDLGCVLCALGEAEGARAAFQAVLQQCPQHLEALFNLGNLQRQCGQFEGAVACYEGVIVQAPGHWRALLSLSVALIGLGREDAAAKALRRAFKASGYSGKVAEEIDMLRRLARKGEDRQRLGRLMEVVSDKTASAVAVAPKNAKRASWGATALAGLRRMAGPAHAADPTAEPAASLDAGLLRELTPLAALPPKALAREANDANLVATGASAGRAWSTVVPAALAEALLRRLLPLLPPLRFQHLMRVTRHELFCALDTAEEGRSVDLGLLLALLTATASAVVEARAEAAHAIMAWRAGSRGVPRASTTLYIAALHAVYGEQHPVAPLRTAQQAEGAAAGEAPLTAPQFVMLLLHPRNGFPAFGALHAGEPGRT